LDACQPVCDHRRPGGDDRPGFSHTIDAPYADSHTSLALPLPPLTMARQQQVPGDSWQVLRVQRGQTLSDLFDKAGIRPPPCTGCWTTPARARR
jgi:hypothetical protein